MNTFLPSQFFDLESFTHKDIFESNKYVWDVLSHLSEYIQALFDNGHITANFKQTKNVYIGEGTIVHDSVDIVGPAIVGKNCIIGHASFLREGVLLGDGVKIGHGAEVKHSLFLSKSTAAHLNYIGDSIIGNKVNISGGAIIANYRFDKKTVRILDGQTPIETNLEKFGAIVGDESVIGVNAVLNPGTILGKKSAVYPLVSVKGTFSDESIIKK